MPLFALPFPSIDPVLIEIGPFSLRWYALAYIVGIFLGWWYAKRLVANQRLWGPAGSPMKPTDIDDFVVWCTLGIILGGRIGYVLFYDLPRYQEHPLEVFALWQGGMSFHGGFLGTVLAMILFSRRAEDPDLVADRRDRAVGDLRPVARTARQFRQWRAVRPGDRRAVGDHLPGRRPGAAPSEPALRGWTGGDRALRRAAASSPTATTSFKRPASSPAPSPPATASPAPSSSSSASPTSRSAISPAA